MTRVRPGLTGVVVLLYLSLIVPVTHLISGFDWIGWYVAFGLMIFAVGLIGRAAGLANGLVGLIQAALIPPALTAAFAADVAWLWVIANARVWDRFSDLAGDLGRAFLLEVSPLVAGEWIFAFVALSGALLAWVFDWYVFTVKAPAATGLFAALIGVVAVAFVRQGLPLTVFAPMALAYLILLAVTATGARPRWAGGAIAAGAVALGLAAGQITPGLGIGGLVEGHNRSDVFIGGDNPLVDLGDDLRASPSTEALRYRSEIGPVYLRLTSLADFDGTTWLHRRGEQRLYTPGQSDYTTVPAGDIAGGAVGATAAVEIEIVELNSEWLPAPYQPIGLRGLDDSLRVDLDDLTLALMDGRTEAQTYSTLVWRADPGSHEARELAVQPLSPEAEAMLGAYTQLAADLPAVIGETARQVAAGVGDHPLDQGLALEAFFRESGFVYSMSTPAREGYDGDSGAVVARFLEVKSGYCVHFAAAMTLMARELGIPARVAVGYLPGNPVSQDGAGTWYSVAADRLHAWPELYIRGSGWVGFEPTVSRGVASAYQSQAPLPSASGAAATPSADPSSAASASASPPSRSASPPTASASPGEPGPDGSTGSDGSAGSSRGPSWQVWSLATAVLLVAAGTAPGWWRMVARRRRMRRGLAGLWAEIVATARDLGLAAPPWRTPAALAAELASWLRANNQDAAAAALERLASRLELAAYAPPGSSGPPGPAGRAAAARGPAAQTPASVGDAPARGTSDRDDAWAVIRGLRRSQSRRARLLAWWLPQSQRRAVRPSGPTPRS
ncbi:MAG: DUF3488 and transglutaminase-like domain-containing protein [Bifidobacteriaceae bacterium]|jgi:transglutaminase-like putative cysteine protease|nr:DUF3488 and transglutaminase-like domain-containing protein [Bifidobacteriaceae bacterium]